jgi:hypothetical protein
VDRSRPGSNGRCSNYLLGATAKYLVFTDIASPQ